MGNSNKPISELVGEVARHDLVLPEMQRRYVWRSTQVRDLFELLDGQQRLTSLKLGEN